MTTKDKVVGLAAAILVAVAMTFAAYITLADPLREYGARNFVRSYLAAIARGDVESALAMRTGNTGGCPEAWTNEAYAEIDGPAHAIAFDRAMILKDDPSQHTVVLVGYSYAQDGLPYRYLGSVALVSVGARWEIGSVTTIEGRSPAFHSTLPLLQEQGPSLNDLAARIVVDDPTVTAVGACQLDMSDGKDRKAVTLTVPPGTYPVSRGDEQTTVTAPLNVTVHVGPEQDED